MRIISGLRLTIALCLCNSAFAQNWIPHSAAGLVHPNFSTIGGITYAVISATMPDSCYRIAGIGPVVKEGNDFSQDFKYEIPDPQGQFSCQENIVTQLSTEVLGNLPPGDYTFSIESYGDTVQTLTFSVSAPSKTIFNYSFEEGRFRLHFDGVFPVRYEIQISSDLKTWTRLTETQGGALFPPSDPGVIIDETASTENCRFYRVQVLTP